MLKKQSLLMSEIGILLFMLRKMRAEHFNTIVETAAAAGTATPRTVTPPLSGASETSWIHVKTSHSNT
jgi:hypothetical protein